MGRRKGSYETAEKTLNIFSEQQQRGGETSSLWWLIGLSLKSLCHLGDNLQTAITVAKNSEMIPMGSQVIIIEANEPGDLLPASVTWQLVGTQEPGSAKKVSRCSKTPGWAWVCGAQPWHGITI